MNHDEGKQMNLKQIAIAVSLLASGAAAMAVEATQWNPPAGHAGRAEVKADLARATANGELAARGEAYAGYVDAHAPQSTMARSEVKQELARARVNGELDNRNEAYSGVTEAHPHATGNTFFAWRKHRQEAKANAASE